MRTEQTTIESTFEAWRHMVTEFSDPTAPITDDELTAACGLIYTLEDDALAVPPATVLDLYRKIVMALDAPEATDTTQEARLVREARAALGLPVNRT